MANYLITGYHGQPHVTAENDRGINAGIAGTGRYVLPVGEQFRAEYVGNNTVRMFDGKLMDNGAAAGIPAGEYIDFQISNAAQGYSRNDLIVFQYKVDTSTLIEVGSFVVVKGEETTDNPVDPALTQQDLLSGSATMDQMALYRVTVESTTINEPVKVFSVSKAIGNHSHTLTELGAAPAGYGLGEVQSAQATNPDTTIKTGWYTISGATIGGAAFYGLMHVQARNPGGLIIQEAWSNSGAYYLTRKSTDGGSTWTEWEWINPPMNIGVEYRTTERINNQPVKKRITSSGELQYSTYDGSTWSEWKPERDLLGITASNIGAFPYRGECTNVDTAIDQGIYFLVGESAAGTFPESAAKYGNLIVVKRHSTAWQLILRQDQLWVRYNTQGDTTWNSWIYLTGWKGLKNMLANGNMVLSSHQYGATLPSAGTKGRIFYKLME